VRGSKKDEMLRQGADSNLWENKKGKASRVAQKKIRTVFEERVKSNGTEEGEARSKGKRAQNIIGEDESDASRMKFISSSLKMPNREK